MPYLELLAVTLAAATWGAMFRGRKIRFHIDCLPVVQAIEARGSSSERSSELLRSLHFIAAKNQYDFTASHIPGLLNVSADLLSRGKAEEFLALDGNQQCDRNATPVGIIPRIVINVSTRR